jgi:hypothetical protein
MSRSGKLRSDEDMFFNGKSTAVGMLTKIRRITKTQGELAKSMVICQAFVKIKTTNLGYFAISHVYKVLMFIYANNLLYNFQDVKLRLCPICVNKWGLWSPQVLCAPSRAFRPYGPTSPRTVKKGSWSTVDSKYTLAPVLSINGETCQSASRLNLKRWTCFDRIRQVANLFGFAVFK